MMNHGLDDAPEQISRSESWQSILLWIGLLTGPAAWTTQLLVNYSLEEFISCTAAARTPGVVLGFGIEPIIFVVNTVLVMATILAGVIAFRCYKVMTPPTGQTATDERARWMAVAGIMVSIMFLLVILLSYAPPLILDVCETSL